jgi:hypothetical protein
MYFVLRTCRNVSFRSLNVFLLVVQKYTYKTTVCLLAAHLMRSHTWYINLGYNLVQRCILRTQCMFPKILCYFNSKKTFSMFYIKTISYSKLLIIQNVWGTGCASYMNLLTAWEKRLQNPTQIKTTRFHFSSFVESSYAIQWVDGWNISDTHAVIQSQFQIDSTVMATLWESMMGSTAGSGWENYYVAGEHMCLTNLFCNNFIQVVNSILHC